MKIDPYKMMVFSIIEDYFPNIVIEEETKSDLRCYTFYQKGYSRINDSLIVNFSLLVPQGKSEYLECLRACFQNYRILTLPREMWDNQPEIK